MESSIKHTAWQMEPHTAQNSAAQHDMTWQDRVQEGRAPVVCLTLCTQLKTPLCAGEVFIVGDGTAACAASSVLTHLFSLSCLFFHECVGFVRLENAVDIAGNSLEGNMWSEENF